MNRSFDIDKFLGNYNRSHKSKPAELVNVADGVKKRVVTSMRSRKSTRLTIFDKIRNIHKIESPVPKTGAKSKVEHRLKQLAKWKEDKERKKKEASSQRKKPFIIGIAHNSITFVPPPPIKAIPSTSGRVTRSQTSKITSKSNMMKTKYTKQDNVNGTIKSLTRSFAPENAKFNPVLNNLVQLPLNPQKTTVKKNNCSTVCSKYTQPEVNTKVKYNTGSKKDKIDKNTKSESSSRRNISPINQRKPLRKVITPKNAIPKSESGSEEKLRSPKLQGDEPPTPKHGVAVQKISPCITMSRGKDNARKEIKKKMEEGLLADDVCEMDNLDHFRRQLNSEIKRMTEMCNTWDKISEQIQLPEPVQEAVLTAVGQARLLMSKKLQQFASLLSRAERPELYSMPVTPADLQGFWDMVFLQVENIDMRFKKLEEMRERNWVDEPPPTRPPAPRRPRLPVNRPGASGPAESRPAASRPPAASRLRELIAAKRKENQEQSQREQDGAEEKKTFEAGFFSVSSPVCTSSAPRRSLLQSVLSSQAKRASASKNNTSYAMLRASLIGKNVDNDNLFTSNAIPLTPVNLCATPARSILKSGNSKSTKKSGKKSIKVVLFDDDKDSRNPSLCEEEADCDTLSAEGNYVRLKQIDKFSTDRLLEDVEKQKENNDPSRRNSKLVQQDAFEDRSPVMTRSRRKSFQTPLVEEKFEKTPRRKRK